MVILKVHKVSQSLLKNKQLDRYTYAIINSPMYTSHIYQTTNLTSPKIYPSNV